MIGGMNIACDLCGKQYGIYSTIFQTIEYIDASSIIADSI